MRAAWPVVFAGLLPFLGAVILGAILAVVFVPDTAAFAVVFVFEGPDAAAFAVVLAFEGLEDISLHQKQRGHCIE